MAFVYIAAAIAAIVLVIRLIRVEAQHWNGLAVGTASSLLFAYLFMIRVRCIGTEHFRCGFCGFRGGFSWHIVAGFVIATVVWVASAALLAKFAGVCLLVIAECLGRWASPLLGLVLACIWETLPVSIVHLQEGSCPGLPVFCHDVPLLGYGGLPYWSAPFVLWAAVSLLANARRVRPAEDHVSAAAAIGTTTR